MVNRRGILKAGFAAPLALSLAGMQGTPGKAATEAPTFVLVHGAWHGGWCWDRVVPLMREAGANVTTPTLTGLGERAHLIDRSVNVDVHAQDIINHIQFEELSNVILVGHSYAGFPVPIATSKLGDAVSHMVLLDAYFPKEGETILDYVDDNFKNDFNAKAAADPGWNMPPLPAELFGLSGDDAAWVSKLLTPQPAATQNEPARYGSTPLPKRTYIRCTESKIAWIFQKSLENVKEDGGFDMLEIAAGHDVMVTNPKELADMLLGLAA